MLAGTVNAQLFKTIDLIGINQMKYAVANKASNLDVGKQVKGDNGKMVYLLDAIHAKPGDRIKIVMHNYTTLPASAMSHNFVLLKQGANAEEVATKCSADKANDYISPVEKDQIIAHTKMTSGGQTNFTLFKVPSKPGKYTYICTFPGHYASGMKGTLIVE